MHPQMFRFKPKYKQNAELIAKPHR